MGCYQCSCWDSSINDPNCFKFCYSAQPIYEESVEVREGYRNQFGLNDCAMYLSWPSVETQNRVLLGLSWQKESTDEEMPFIWDIWVSQSTIHNSDEFKCVQWHEPNDPHTWCDNFMCLPSNSSYEMKFINDQLV